MNNLNEILTDIFRHIDTDSLTYNDFQNCYEYDVQAISQKYFNQPCSVNFGASRFCIIPENEDFIIKVPFIGESYEYWFESNEEDDDEDLIEHIRQNCIITNEDESCIDYIEPFTGCCFLGEHFKDYCETEIAILDYIASEYENLEPFFCNLEKVGVYYGVPVYKQSKVTVIENTEFACFDINSSSKTQYSKEYNSLRTNCNTYESRYMFNKLNAIWLINVVSLYGANTLRDLLDFIYHNINDLHEGNYGWIDNKPVIFDFAGFSS